LFITYDWRENFIDLQEAVWNGLDFLAENIRERHPDIDTEPLIADEVTIWVDFIFINQCARDLRSELSVLPDIIASSDIHFALSRTALTRAWCCYELGLYNKRFISSDEMPSLHSFVTPAMLNYRGWSEAEATVPEDKVLLEEQLQVLFPKGGISGLDALLIQASLIGDLFFERGNPVWAELAMDEAMRAADKWLHRLGWIPDNQEEV
jgi:hypothetical protein